jgi:hypothetical protein
MADQSVPSHVRALITRAATRSPSRDIERRARLLVVRP